MSSENEFSPIIRTLGKGKKGSRSLSLDEAELAFQLVLNKEVEDVQLGAFLMLLRVKEESAEEIAGFVKACRNAIRTRFNLEQDTLSRLNIDIDWSSYAGKRKQHPWFILVLALLAQNGYRTVIHGTQGHTEDRLYTEQAFSSLNLPIANTMDDIEAQLNRCNLSFISVETLMPRLQDLIDMRPLFGLRSPVHTLCRLINPFSARYSFSSIFHPAYAETHQHAAKLLGDNSLSVFKGESGEIERKPEASCLVKSYHQGECTEEKWPRLQENKQTAIEQHDAQYIRKVYENSEKDDYAEKAIIGTLAICLKQLESLTSQEQALEKAKSLWEKRDLKWFEQF